MNIKVEPQEVPEYFKKYVELVEAIYNQPEVAAVSLVVIPFHGNVFVGNQLSRDSKEILAEVISHLLRVVESSEPGVTFTGLLE